MQSATERRAQLIAEIMQADESSGIYQSNTMADIKSFSDDELINELEIHRDYRVFNDTAPSCKKAVDFASETLTTEQILDRLDEYDIYDYAVKHVNPDDVDVEDFLVPSKSGPNIYKTDAIKLILELAAENGWDFVYALVEPHKIV